METRIPGKTGNAFKIVVDYTKNLEQTITDGGFNWVNNDITDENFHIPDEIIGKKIELSAKLFYFSNYINADDATLEMNKDGYRPATLMELLALKLLFPESIQFGAIALGSFWHDEEEDDDPECCYFPSFGISEKGPILDMCDDHFVPRAPLLGIKK